MEKLIRVLPEAAVLSVELKHIVNLSGSESN
jgi:hypothetical protein